MKLTCVATVVAVATTTAAAAPALQDRRLYVLRGVDIVGRDTTNVGNIGAFDCFRTCYKASISTNPPCSATTWTDYNGGTCWLKAASFTTTRSIPKTDAYSLLILEDSVSETIVSGTSMNVDMPGNDLSTTNRKLMSQCRDDCVATKGCYAVVWTDYNGGTCWLKSRASTFVPKAGVQSAYVAWRINSL